MGQTLTRTLTPFDCNKCQMMSISLSLLPISKRSYVLLLWTKQSVCIPNFWLFSFRLHSPLICTFFFALLYWSSFRVFFIFSSVFTSFLYLYICQTTPRIPPKGLTQPTHTSSPSTSRCFSYLEDLVYERKHSVSRVLCQVIFLEYPISSSYKLGL